jgi:two-component system chemotaxis response regulator CheY
MNESLHLGALTALIVEPSAMQARVVANHLMALGLPEPRHATDIAGALEAMRAEPTELVISALYLPDGTGPDLVGRMRADPTLEHIAFILVSSETNPRALEPVRQSGVCAIVPKPFTDAQLARALQSSLDLLAGEALAQTDIPMEDLKVLVVDDSAHSRRFIRRVLGNLGVEHFIEAADGTEALAILADTLVDLVVTDYNMPEMDGRQLVEHIRQQSWQRTVPILMVTSESDAGRLAAVQAAGVSGICDKPFEPDTVRALLGRLLSDR